MRMHVSSLTVVCWCALVFAQTVDAQSPEWVALQREVGSLYQQGKYTDAAVFATKALEMATREFGPDHPIVALSLNNLAMLYGAQGKYEDAQPLLHDAVDGRTKRLGPQHPHTFASIKNLIELYEAWGKPEEAEKWRARLSSPEAAE